MQEWDKSAFQLKNFFISSTPEVKYNHKIAGMLSQALAHHQNMH